MADGSEVQRVRTGQEVDVKAGQFGFPSGHLGHLSAEQEQALVQFKEIIQKAKLYTPATGNKPASHDDITLLRFLRARRFVPQDALGQFKDTEAWRKQNHIKELYDNIDIGDYEETRQLYPQWTGRRDKRGIPVYCFEVAPLNSKTMSAYNKSSEKTRIINIPAPSSKDKESVPPRLLRLFALYENLIEFTLPLCTKLADRPNPDTPISQSNNIVDISKVGLKQFWNLRSHMQDASQLATAHYPETLDRIFIVGAPSFFPTVWGWIKRWFDPITTSKIFILSEHNAYNTLSSFIDPQNIPKKYGGKLDWHFGDKPILDPEESAHLKFKEGIKGWPQGPLRWIEKSNNVWDLVGLGSYKGKERREMIGQLNFEDIAVSKAASRQPTRPTTADKQNVPPPMPSSARSDGATAAAAAASLAAAPTAVRADQPSVPKEANGTAPAIAPAHPDAHLPPQMADDIVVPSNPATPSMSSSASEEESTARGIADLAVSAPEVVVEKPPYPPQPLITPEVPLNAVATNLPAPTPSEKQVELGAGVNGHGVVR